MGIGQGKCRASLAALLGAGSFVVASAGAQAATIVNDTWADGNRNEPPATITSPFTTPYSEYATDQDGDGNIESAWFKGNAGTLSVVGAGGPLRGDLVAGGTSSATWQTYVTPEGNEINLAKAGDQAKTTWVFTPTGTNATNTSQGLRVAFVNTPTDGTNPARITGDTSAANAAYAGYSLFLNFGQTTGRSTPFQLLERGVSGDLLSTSGNWTAVANAPGFGNGAVGYTDGNA